MKTKNQIAIFSGIAVILAAAAIVGSYNVQIAKAQNFGKTVSEIAKSDPRSLGLGDGSTGECGGDGCSDDGTGNSGKQFGKDVSRAANKNK